MIGTLPGETQLWNIRVTGRIFCFAGAWPKGPTQRDRWAVVMNVGETGEQR